MCTKKVVKKSDYVIDRNCIWSNKTKIEEMEDQVLIPRENAHYLLLILIIHIGGLFPFPDTQQVKHAGQGRYWSEIWCGLSDISFHRSDQTRFFRRIISVHSGWKLYYKTSLVPSGMHINDLAMHAWSLSMERICRQFTHSLQRLLHTA